MASSDVYRSQDRGTTSDKDEDGETFGSVAGAKNGPVPPVAHTIHQQEPVYCSLTRLHYDARLDVACGTGIDLDAPLSISNFKMSRERAKDRV